MSEKDKESSSQYFERSRPKFLDWEPPTEEEKLRAVKARADAREAEFRRVTAIAAAKETARRGTFGRRSGKRRQRLR